VVQDSGLIVAEKNDTDWARAIGNLLEDRSRREELGARGLDRAHAEFAWPVVARKYIDFFESI
jgi:glycosyltransferase involved in cell wall biosynthesis